MTPHYPGSYFRRLIVAGLLVLAPAALTVGAILWIFRSLDGILGPAVTRLTGWSVPGVGFVATILVVLFLGFVSMNVLGRRFIGAMEALIKRIPVARSLYGSSQGLLESLASQPTAAFRRVVLLEYPRAGIWSVGFVTGTVERRSDQTPTGRLLTIFIPTTPLPTSGFLVLVPENETVDLQLTVEEGVQLVISGGVLQPAGWKPSDSTTSAPGASP